MTKDDIIRMAREACWTGIYSEWSSPTERTSITVPVTIEQIERFAALVAAAEREANAKLCNSLARWHGQLVTAAFDHAADSIRAKGETTDTNERDEELRTRSKLQESSQNDTQ